MRVCVHAQLLSCVRLFVTPWTVAHQVPLSMGFSRQEYWNRQPSPLPRGLDRPTSPVSPALAGRFFATEPLGKPFGFAYWLGVEMGQRIIAVCWRGRLQLSVHHFLISFDYACIVSNTLLGYTIRNTMLLSLWYIRSLWISPLGCHSVLVAHYGHHSHFFLFFEPLLFKFSLNIGVYSIYTDVLAWSVQQSDSIIHIAVVFQSLSHVQLFVTPWTEAH